jgi:protein involved in polysaccharide export with SLBB domain
MQMTELLKTATVAAVAVFLVSCRSSVSDNPGKADYEYVQISVSGEVKRQGQVPIRRNFTKESILEAVGGFTYGSNMGATPTRLKLKRYANREWKEWEIRFDEMPHFRAEGFRFQDGDIIEVPRLFF